MTGGKKYNIKGSEAAYGEKEKAAGIMMKLPDKKRGRGYNMISELDTVALTRDVAEYNLIRGDIGAVTHCYGEDDAFEVEFITADGKTIALLTLKREDVRPICGKEVLHVRELIPMAV